MKNLFLGLLIGAAIATGVIWFATVPGMKETAYNSGFEAGNKAGVETGTSAGIATGLEQARQKDIADSLEMEELNRKALEARTRTRKKIDKPIQNWHVINGKIGEPVQSEPIQSEPVL